MIIGGGIAGMEAARQLLLLGYTPIIVEKKDHLGGHVARWHKLFPDMAPAGDLVRRLSEAISEANIFLETRITSINRLSNGYVVMLSNGVSIPCRAVLGASGFRLFDASKKEEYGYGVYNHVITNSDLEAWFNGAEDPRIVADPKAVGFVHCVGSRDLKAGNSQCSKVCCMTAVKQAIELKERFPSRTRASTVSTWTCASSARNTRISTSTPSRSTASSSSAAGCRKSARRLNKDFR